MLRRNITAAVAAAQQDLAPALDAEHERFGATIISSTYGLRVHVSSARADGCPVTPSLSGLEQDAFALSSLFSTLMVLFFSFTLILTHDCRPSAAHSSQTSA